MVSISCNKKIKAKAFYKRVNNEAKEEYDFSSSDQKINYIGHYFLETKQIEKAIKVFQFNVETHPKSAIAYEGLGEAYLMNGDKELCIKNYKRSFILNPRNTKAVEVLESFGIAVERAPHPSVSPVRSKRN